MTKAKILGPDEGRLFKRENEMRVKVASEDTGGTYEICYENCPLTVLEAMSAGRPTIGSRIGEIAELVHEEKTGWLFETGSVADFERAVRQLLASPDVTAQVGQTARRRFLERYAPPLHIERLLSIYNEVLASKKGQSA